MSHAAAAAPLAPLSILVADDNLDAAESLGILLQMEGHAVHLAGDGLQALALAERVRPDVAVLDVGMPGLDGLELTRSLRQQPWGRDMLIVALTAGAGGTTTSARWAPASTATSPSRSAPPC